MKKHWFQVLVLALIFGLMVAVLSPMYGPDIEQRFKEAENRQRRELAEMDGKDIRIFRDWHGSVGKIEIFKDGNAQGHGTGFLVEREGKIYVLTAGHVAKIDEDVAMGRKAPVLVSLNAADSWKIKFGFQADAKVYDLEVVKIHETADCALLSIKDPPKKAFRLGKVPERGADCWIIGYPLWFDSMLGKGIISGKDGANYTMDAGIAPGNSGSPVFNEKGEVYGIAVAVPRWQFTVLTYIAICTSVSQVSDLFRGLE